MQMRIQREAFQFFEGQLFENNFSLRLKSNDENVFRSFFDEEGLLRIMEIFIQRKLRLKLIFMKSKC